MPKRDEKEEEEREPILIKSIKWNFNDLIRTRGDAMAAALASQPKLKEEVFCYRQTEQQYSKQPPCIVCGRP